MSDYVTTPNYGLYKPVVGADVDIWGQHWNANADTLDAALTTANTSYLPLIGGTVTGHVSFQSGIDFGNSTAGSVTDFSKGIQFYPGYGINLTSSHLNIVSGATISLVSGATDALDVSASGISAHVPATFAGNVAFGGAPMVPAATSVPFLTTQGITVTPGSADAYFFNAYNGNDGHNHYLTTGVGGDLAQAPDGTISVTSFVSGAANAQVSGSVTWSFAPNGAFTAPGNIVVGGAPQVPAGALTPTLSAKSVAVVPGAAGAYFFNLYGGADGYNHYLTNGVAGYLFQGTDGTLSFGIYPSGTAGAQAAGNVALNFSPNGNFTSPNGVVAGASGFYLSVSGGYFSSDANYTYLNMDSSGYRLVYTRSNGTLFYQNSSGTSLFSIDSSGNITANNNVTATNGSITAATTITSNNGRVRALTSGEPCFACVIPGTAGAGMYLNSGGFLGFGATDGSGLPTANWMYLDYAGSYLDLLWNTAYKPGGGTWTDNSDERLKRDIRQYEAGLAEVIKLRPVTYEFNGRGETTDDGRRYHGLVAQQAQSVMPEMVGTRRRKLDPHDRDDTDLLTVDATPLIYALVNAVKTLDARLTATGA